MKKNYFWRQMFTKFYLFRPSFLVNLSFVIHLPFPHLCKCRWYFLAISISISWTNLFISIFLPLSHLCLKNDFFGKKLVWISGYLSCSSFDWVNSFGKFILALVWRGRGERGNNDQEQKQTHCLLNNGRTMMADVDGIDRVSVLQSIEPCQLHEISNDSNLDGYNKTKGQFNTTFKARRRQNVLHSSLFH